MGIETQIRLLPDPAYSRAGNHPVFDIVFRAAPGCLPGSIDLVAIFGMEPLQEPLVVQRRARRNIEDPEDFIGPFQAVARHIDHPGANVAHLLRFLEQVLLLL